MFQQSIPTAVRQIERWLVASRQDQHPAIALLHANYAMGDIDLVRQLWTDQEITTATGKHIDRLLAQATMAQDKAQQRLVALCPELNPFGEE